MLVLRLAVGVVVAAMVIDWVVWLDGAGCPENVGEAKRMREEKTIGGWWKALRSCSPCD